MACGGSWGSAAKRLIVIIILSEQLEPVKLPRVSVFKKTRYRVCGMLYAHDLQDLDDILQLLRKLQVDDPSGK
jgi:hypothetical protein